MIHDNAIPTRPHHPRSPQRSIRDILRYCLCAGEDLNIHGDLGFGTRIDSGRLSCYVVAEQIVRSNSFKGAIILGLAAQMLIWK